MLYRIIEDLISNTPPISEIFSDPSRQKMRFILQFSPLGSAIVEEVTWFDISVDDVELMYSTQSKQQIVHVFLDF